MTEKSAVYNQSDSYILVPVMIRFLFNVSIWATAHPLLPNVNPNLLSVDCCRVKGGVGA